MFITPFAYQAGILRPRLALVEGPESEPVALAEAKAQCRVDFDDEDALITGLIKAARLLVESRLSRSLIATRWDYTLDTFQGVTPSSYSPIKLPVAAVLEVDSITYRDANGTSTTLNPSLYRASLGAPGFVEPVPGAVFPVTSPWHTGAVTIRFTAGYGEDADAVPETLKLAIKFLAATWYTQREHINIGNIVNEIPDTVEALISPERWY